tara:strand:+ start:821 stop:1033 length:213 start_codon:yes stop_codon:yes gene_type:complete
MDIEDLKKKAADYQAQAESVEKQSVTLHEQGLRLQGAASALQFEVDQIVNANGQTDEKPDTKVVKKEGVS